MIRSMTGFGEASTEDRGTHYAVELRSLNNKYFKVTTRLPDEVAGLEAELESRLRKGVARGSFGLVVKRRASDAEAASRINEAALLEYLGHLETIHQKVQDQSVHIDLSQILGLPGVLQPAEEEPAIVERARPVLLELLDQAAARLTAMRETEGAGLAEDLRGQLRVIRDRAKVVRERGPRVIEEYQQRLRDRIDELAAAAKLEVDKKDLIREVALFADRADIAEELTRIEGHLQQFEQVLQSKSNEPAGRTLDFIAQELLREANTMASKSNDATISRNVVEIKSAIDRIKEQVQNVE